MNNLQRNYIQYLDEIKVILKSINLETNKQDELIHALKKFEILVPVVGAFSAGKSTMINSFLGSDILSTNIAPETAIATELRYNPKSYIELIKLDGTSEIFEVHQKESIKENTNNYQLLRLYLNNEKLKSIEPIILVDMPGFDSPIDVHNTTILNYLDKGKYFVIVISIEDGTITRSISRRIENIHDFSHGFSVCISKTDIRPKSDVERVRNEIKEQLINNFNYENEIFSSGKKDIHVLENLVKYIDITKLFQNMFLGELKTLNSEIQSTIKTKISTIKSSQEEANRAIINLENALKEIQLKEQKSLENLNKKRSKFIVDNITISIENKLIASVDFLASLALSQPSELEGEIKHIVQTELLKKMEEEFSSVSSEIVKSFEESLNNFKTPSFELGESWMLDVSEKIITFLEKYRNGIDIFNDKMKFPRQDDLLYKPLGLIAIVAKTALKNVFQVIIDLLPFLISILNSERKKEEEIKRKILIEVIPYLKKNLLESLPNLIGYQIDQMENSISQKFEEALKEKKSEIERFRQEKNQDTIGNETKISALENAIEQIDALTKQYLYQ